ncbi:CCAAT/enhancer-binding protein, partial [Bacteroides sp. 51]|uniref:CCAAT/enhancer-binding protein n=1 Tax=Bacteroides sp. 51 TaxID=2302938 RepID=UPI001940233A
KMPSVQLKAPSSRTSRKHSNNKRMPEKHSDEYRQKRERNNIAVRKSRFKTKQKFHETLQKVEELTEENDQLHGRIEVLTKELTVLRNLFSNPTIFKDQALARALLAQGLAEHSA